MPPTRLPVTIMLSREHLAFVEDCAASNGLVSRDDVVDAALTIFRMYVDTMVAHINAEEAKGRSLAEILRTLDHDFTFRTRGSPLVFLRAKRKSS
jgi:hypothetical protein